MDEGTPVAPVAPATDTTPDAGQTPPAQTVPLAVHIQERRTANGRIASLTAKLAEMERSAVPAATAGNGNQSEEDRVRDQWHDKLKLKDPLAKITMLENKLKELEGKATRGEQAHNQIMASASRTMDKAEAIAVKSFTPDLASLGFDKDTWNSFVASQLTEDDVQEIFVSPSHMNEVIKRCKGIMAPKLNQHRAQQANTVLNLPRTPGPGGQPLAPPANEPLKVGKPLHSRAFARLQGAMGRGEE